MTTEELNVEELNDNLNTEFSISPTCYHEGMKVRCLNMKNYCTLTQLQALFQKDLLKENDITILQTLYTYHFCTKFSLTNLIALLPEEVKKRANYKKALSKLSKQGLVLCYILEWQDHDKVKNTPHFYTLSKSSYEYVRKISGNRINYAHLLKPVSSSALDIIKSATFSQFHARMMADYKDRIIQSYIHLKIKNDTDDSGIDIPGVYRFHTHLLGSGHLDYVVLPVRSNPDSVNEAAETIKICESYKWKSNALFDNPFYILICENGEHAWQVDTKLKKTPLKNLPILYVLDRSLIKNKLLTNLFTVKTTDSGYELILQNIEIVD